MRRGRGIPNLEFMNNGGSLQWIEGQARTQRQCKPPALVSVDRLNLGQRIQDQLRTFTVDPRTCEK